MDGLDLKGVSTIGGIVGESLGQSPAQVWKNRLRSAFFHQTG
ncbi:hypothetical protein [Thiothrix fructosivorans]|nr:hypothetical protein [Thiothrix fructosivorans]